jgi:hypothetical protein
MSRDVFLLLSFAVLILVAAHVTSRPTTPPKKPGRAGNTDLE